MPQAMRPPASVNTQALSVSLLVQVRVELQCESPTAITQDSGEADMLPVGLGDDEPPQAASSRQAAKPQTPVQVAVAL